MFRTFKTRHHISVGTDSNSVLKTTWSWSENVSRGLPTFSNGFIHEFPSAAQHPQSHAGHVAARAHPDATRSTTGRRFGQVSVWKRAACLLWKRPPRHDLPFTPAGETPLRSDRTAGPCYTFSSKRTDYICEKRGRTRSWNKNNSLAPQKSFTLSHHSRNVCVGVLGGVE